MDPNRDPAVALQYGCPFCAARPGENCRRGDGIILELPHYSRTPETTGTGRRRTDG